MKNNRILAGLMVSIMMLSLFPIGTWAAGLSGSGTLADPYVITTAAELNAIRNDLSANYKLGNDIDLSDSEYDNAWNPIGTYIPDTDDPSGEVPDLIYAFTGVFDGDGHTITGLNIPQGVACVGLFGVVANATVENLTIKDATVSGNVMTGAAIGYAYNSSLDHINLAGTNTITGTINEGAAPNMVAGLVGAGMDSSISNCNVTGTTITVNCLNNATQLGENAHDIGLIGGGLEGCNLENCSANSSSITANGAYCFGIGGLSGCAFGTEDITNCDVTNVTVTVGNNAYLIGGLTGYTGRDGSNAATRVYDCDVTNVSVTVGDNSARVGGLIGGGFYLDLFAAYFPLPSRFDLISCTTSGALTAGFGSEAVGTVVGYACRCDTTGGTSTMTGASSLVGAEQELFAGGDGTVLSPYQVSNAAQLYAIRYDMGANYRLTADIDLLNELGPYFSDVGWSPIGDFNDYFTGTFDGANHTISNLIAFAEEGVGIGLFGISYGGTVKNVTIADANVTGMMAVAPAVGYNIAGTVENVSVMNSTVNAIYCESSVLAGGEPIGGNCVGGVVGGNNMGSIIGCIATDITINLAGYNTFDDDGPYIQCDVAECAGLIVGGSFGGNEMDVTDSSSTGVIKDCVASGTINASHPDVIDTHAVGLGGLGGCLLMMEEVTNCHATVTINANQAHAVGGICGYAGSMETNNPQPFTNCSANITLNLPGSTHVGGLVGTGLYYRGLETIYRIASDCSVSGTINARSDSQYQAGAVAGRAVGSTIEDGITNNVTGLNIIGTTQRMYRTGEQDLIADGGDDAVDVLDALSGTYQALFAGAIFESEYDHYWHDYCSAILGADNADAMVALLKTTVGASTYGADATDNFFCGFAEGVNNFTFNGSQISGYAEDGTQIFSHTYRFVRSEHLAGVMPCYIFQSTDNNHDEFKYFLLCADTPDSTYHIEFRYGSDLDDLLKVSEGAYANWLAAGILTSALADPDETMIEKVIALFCLENMDYSAARSASSLRQLADFVGTWDADLSAYPELADGALYCVLDASGIGKTYAYGQLAHEYNYYAYENDSSARSGIYIAYNHAEDEFESSPYTFTVNGQGQTVLTFWADDGNISWIKRTSSSSGGGSGSSSSSGGGSNRGYTISVPTSVQNGTISVSPKNADQGETVTITVTPNSGYELEVLELADQNGNKITLTDKGNGTFTFTMPATQVTVKVSFRESDSFEVKASFRDVAADAYYAQAIEWAVENGVTAGTTATTFDPDTACTRAQFVTFLWRAMGSPAPTVSTNPFQDVDATAYYYQAVSWAVENDITDGTSGTTFSPDEIVTRAQTVTFIWRSDGSPATTTANLFTDVNSDTYYYNAVVWAVAEGITNGTYITIFDPLASCTRAQVVTLLFRHLGE